MQLGMGKVLSRPSGIRSCQRASYPRGQRQLRQEGISPQGAGWTCRLTSRPSAVAVYMAYESSRDPLVQASLQFELNDDPALHPWCSLLNRRTPPHSRGFHIRGGGETVARRRTFEWFGVLPLMPEHWTCRNPNRLSSYREFRNDYRSSAD